MTENRPVIFEPEKQKIFLVQQKKAPDFDHICDRVLSLAHSKHGNPIPYSTGYEETLSVYPDLEYAKFMNAIYFQKLKFRLWMYPKTFSIPLPGSPVPNFRPLAFCQRCNDLLNIPGIVVRTRTSTAGRAGESTQNRHSLGMFCNPCWVYQMSDFRDIGYRYFNFDDYREVV